jgi:putative membrane protein
MNQLHPGARWAFRLRAYFTMIFLSFFFTFWILGILSAFAEFGILAFVGAYLFVYILIIIGVAEIYARMAYNRWFYEFTPDQLRFERGIIWKKYTNIPYERIQNVDITRGIIARIFGFSTVNIQTAGATYMPNKAAWAEGYLPGVSIEEAEHIREFVVKKVSKKGRSQGL